ncbi:MULTISPECIES: GNAT family N-acetyltransferase [Clostridium]|uniref:GNAT family N-acetyltransferase n=1 Tax=Clostridium TaxID=1485 RepID=UPI0009839EB2|nr:MULTISPECIES: GNAT family N-acetyltransferase [Clostridium]AQR95735.1 mycothiol acetyltransferase [Clostridium saccharoperbutylacetonicum]NSB31598.1 ribosomal protein S18 acetylase RimI-like enzyme [Clostridium saccharoperbutylacetonicum]
MVLLEKLSLFNMEHFRKLYNKNEDAYTCNKSFFEIYDEEHFLIKYLIRKQIKLFKVNKEYIGYIWYEYPSQSGLSNIYAIYLKEEYMDMINTRMLSFFKRTTFRYDMIASSRNSNIMKKLNFNVNSKNILMKIKTTNFINVIKDCIKFRHFKEGQDEELRCEVQNSVFNDKNRIPLTIEDVRREEAEEYYINNFGVFIYNNQGQVVGYGQVIYNKGLYTIVNLGILKEHRRHGYGEVLLRYLINICKQNSINDVYIRVDKDNLKAIALYTKVGFKEYQSFVSWYKHIN